MSIDPEALHWLERSIEIANPKQPFTISFGLVRKLVRAARENAELHDKIEGLDSDLSSAVEVAYEAGAIEWVMMNYPAIYKRLAGK